MPNDEIEVEGISSEKLSVGIEAMLRSAGRVKREEKTSSGLTLVLPWAAVTVLLGFVWQASEKSTDLKHEIADIKRENTEMRALITENREAIKSERVERTAIVLEFRRETDTKFIEGRKDMDGKLSRYWRVSHMREWWNEAIIRNPTLRLPKPDDVVGALNEN